MTDAHELPGTRTSKWVKATPEVVYKACTDPDALVVWLVPGDMTGKIHYYDGRVGGGYEMSLYYSQSDSAAHGKTAAGEDRYTARYVELSPPYRIVESIMFDADDPGLGAEMLMYIILNPENDGTMVTIAFENLPAGVTIEDNEKGTQSSLDKLARYVE